MRPRYILYAAAFIVGSVLAWQVRGCFDTDEGKDRPPAVIPEGDVFDPFDDPEIPLLERPFRRSVQPRARGTASSPETVADRDSFVASAADSAAPPRFARFDVATDKKGLKSIGAVRSDGVYERQDFDCPHPCVAGGRDTVMFAHTQRALPRLLPDVLKGAAHCAAFAGVGWGLAYASGFDRPGLVAGAAGGACVLVKVTQ